MPRIPFISFFKRTKRESQGGQRLTLQHVLKTTTQRRFPSYAQWKHLFRILEPKERLSVRLAASCFVMALLFLGGGYAWTHRTTTAATGGEYTEGLIGEPQFINPLYASLSDVDADLTSLVYSGLMRWSQDGQIIPDLASDVIVSDDQKTYTFHLTDGAQFHNGDLVRARDVVFTVATIQNPQYRSPLLSTLQNVSLEQIDDTTVAFTLPEPSATFLSHLTFGILPADTWSSVSPKNASIASFNLEPVGSGPYRFKEFTKDKQGTILTYVLERNRDFYREGPQIDTLTFKFYASAGEAVQALQNKNIEGVSFVPPDLIEAASSNHAAQIVYPTLNRATALFFNQEKNPLLKKAEVRTAINQTINKTAIIEEVLQGHGVQIDNPLLPLTEPLPFHTTRDVQVANSILDNAGYPRSEEGTWRVISDKKRTEPTDQDLVRFTLTTVNTNEFLQVAEHIKKDLEELGIQITISPVSQEELLATVLPARAYELLLTGTLADYTLDPYPFWHSSQNTETGLNLAGYKNKEADTLLEKARTELDIAKRQEDYRAFADLLAKDVPAVFLYQSTYAYAIATKIHQATNILHIVHPKDRFATITEWYIKTKTSFR